MIILVDNKSVRIIILQTCVLLTAKGNIMLQSIVYFVNCEDTNTNKGKKSGFDVFRYGDNSFSHLEIG